MQHATDVILLRRNSDALAAEVADLRREIETATRHRMVAMVAATVTVWLTVVLPQLL